MAEVVYKPDRKGTAALMVTRLMQGAMQAAAYEAIPFARSISPDAPPYGSGYVASFEVTGGTEKIARTRRAVAYLTNTAPHAAAVEYGQLGDRSRADTGHHVLARTADYIERG